LFPRDIEAAGRVAGEARQADARAENEAGQEGAAAVTSANDQATRAATTITQTDAQVMARDIDTARLINVPLTHGRLQ